MKVERIIEKFGLRDECLVAGTLGQKMDEECIQRFVDNDPSGNGKYLEWMFYQAGGGQTKLLRSMRQWDTGEHGEPPLKLQLREKWIADYVAGYLDDDNNPVAPISAELAESRWPDDEVKLRSLHVYGDQDYVDLGCFGFYRKWTPPAGLYDQIVMLVTRFHKHRASLRSKGKSTDLSLANYPNLSNLAKALEDLTAAELRSIQDYDTIYTDEWLIVACPYTIGASLKLGIPKWCTSNESGFVQALSGSGKNRWKEYAAGNALYYCRFRKLPKGACSPVEAVAIQVPFTPADAMWQTLPMEIGDLHKVIAASNFWDSEDKNTELAGWLTKMTRHPCMTMNHVDSFQKAIRAVALHFRTFPQDRLVLDFGI